MSFIHCPECGSKISTKALSCPYCGYVSDNSALAISLQDTYEINPLFTYEIEEWKPLESELIGTISYQDNRALLQSFGKWSYIQHHMPALAETISAMAKQEKYLVATMDNYVKDLIKKGVYMFSIDKNGDTLPTIRDAHGIVKQVRLKDVNFSPDLYQSLNNLSTQAMMARLLMEIEYVGESIREIHHELQNDRLALADSSRDKLIQALKIQDSQLRQIAIINIINSATDAKRILMRSFTQGLSTLQKQSKKSEFQMMLDFKGSKMSQGKSLEAMQSLISITNVVQIECEGYAILGELDAAKVCLVQFKDFIEENRLNDRNTLLVINEGLDYKQTQIVEEFSQIARQITDLEMGRMIKSPLVAPKSLNGEINGK